MRLALPALIAACVLVPAAASAAESDSDAGRLAEALRDPARQAQIAATAEAVTGAVLAMPAAPLMKSLAEIAGEDPERIDPDLRVGDLVDTEDAEAPREFAHRLPQMMGAMATMAATLEAMLPELRAMGDRIAEDLHDPWVADAGE
ncbi:MAG TPA: hypothetical protein VEB68_10765 [Croceibacterium sp.]|nr:hypothetical protein [Croceibacterium sp.]